MDRLLASQAMSEDEADARLNDLQAKYPDREFKKELLDRKWKFSLVHTSSDLVKAELDKISRTARGADPVVLEPADPKDPKATEGIKR